MEKRLATGSGIGLFVGVVSLCVAAAIGYLHLWVSVTVWSVYPIGNPLHEWLLAVLARRGHHLTYTVAITAHDLVVNLVLALLFGAVCFSFRALNNWRCVLVAAVATTVAGHESTNWSWPLVSHWQFWLSVATSVLSLPAAFAAIRWANRVWPPDAPAVLSTTPSRG